MAWIRLKMHKRQYAELMWSACFMFVLLTKLLLDHENRLSNSKFRWPRAYQDASKTGASQNNVVASAYSGGL